MRSMLPPGCLTRVVSDEYDLEVVQLQSAVQRIQAELCDVPAAQREYIANALLHLAMSGAMSRLQPQTEVFNRALDATAW